MLSLADGLAGSLLGQALGDALGFVVEGAPPEQAVAYVGCWLRAGQVVEQGHEPFPFGQYSDDTQLVRELLLVFRQAGCFDPELFAARIAELFRRGADVGAGPGTRAAAHRLLGGVPWSEAATPAPYAGNGAAMRAGPIGLLARDPSELVQLARAQSQVTHADPLCAAGAIAVAGAVALASRAHPIDRSAFIAELADLVAPVEAGLGAAVLRLADWGGLEPAEALTELHRQRLDPAAAPHWRGITGHVGPSVLWSLYAFLRTPDDYGQSVGTAISAGGDTDTTGAMARGARLGAPGLPADLVARVTDRGGWGGAALAGLARDCAEQLGLFRGED
jgi:ADP-ribosylglycohydrolase